MVFSYPRRNCRLVASLLLGALAFWPVASVGETETTGEPYQLLLAAVGAAHHRQPVPAVPFDQALEDLSQTLACSKTQVLCRALEIVDGDSDLPDPLVFELARHLLPNLPPELAPLRLDFQRIALKSNRRATCQVGWALLVMSDQHTDLAWKLASSSDRGLRELIQALSLLPDPNLHSQFHHKILGLVDSQQLDTDQQISAPVLRAAIRAIAEIPTGRVDSFDVLVRLHEAQVEPVCVLESLLRLPKEEIKAERLSHLAHILDEFAKTLETKTPLERAARALAIDLATRLPEQIGAAIAGEYAPEIYLRITPHRAGFERKQLVVQAASRASLVFDNADLMPHNLIMVPAGRMLAYAQAAEQMAGQEDAFASGFVPNRLSKEAWSFVTGVVEPRQCKTFEIALPQQPGDYVYLCTLPGHWRTMYGTLRVVEDLEQYLREHPPEADPLNQNRPRPFVRDWTVDELLPELEQVSQGRSFEQGKAMFAAASCSACHRLNDFGPLVGPDLTRLDPKFVRAQLLRKLINPAAQINPKFRLHAVITDEGEQVSGLITREDEHEVELLPSPLDNCEPRIVPLEAIEARKDLELSMMPIGLLSTLSKEEIFDLLAYLEASGNPDSPHFE